MAARSHQSGLSRATPTHLSRAERITISAQIKPIDQGSKLSQSRRWRVLVSRPLYSLVLSGLCFLLGGPGDPSHSPPNHEQRSLPSSPHACPGILRHYHLIYLYLWKLQLGQCTFMIILVIVDLVGEDEGHVDCRNRLIFLSTTEVIGDLVQGKCLCWYTNCWVCINAVFYSPSQHFSEEIENGFVVSNHIAPPNPTGLVNGYRAPNQQSSSWNETRHWVQKKPGCVSHNKWSFTFLFCKAQMPFLSLELIPIFSKCACSYLIETHIHSS